jgi:hypothetical protein
MLPANMFSKHSVYVIWVGSSILLYFLASLFFSKGMFYLGYSDGFYSQMINVDNNPTDFRILAFVHWLRFLVVYPFWWLSKNNYSPILESLVLLLYFTPLFMLNVDKRTAYLRFFLLVLPFFLSYRACLTIISITILFFYIAYSNKNNLIFLFSALLSVLSSGVTIPWLAIVVLCRNSLGVRRSVKILSMSVVFISILLSTIHKISFFEDLQDKQYGQIEKVTESSAATDLEQVPFKKPMIEAVSCGKDLVCKVLRRNTVYVSYMSGRYGRLFLYLGMMFLLTFSWYIGFINHLPENKFFAISLLGFFLEGLWVISFLFATFLFLGRFLSLERPYFNLRTLKQEGD